MPLHDYQQKCADTSVEFLVSSGRNASRMFKGPTGCGKSFIIVDVKRRLGETCYVVAPTHEIAQGMYQKSGGTGDRESAGYWTVKRLYNELQKGAIPLPKYLIFDESHHTVDNTHSTLWALCGFPPRVGFTATDYRGTPFETGKLRESWGKAEEIIGLRAAVSRNVIALPNFLTWPLLDDHTIDVVNGEFVVRQMDNAVKDKLQDLADRISAFYVGTRYDRPTMVAFSSVEQCRNALHVFRKSGLPSVAVVGVSDPDFESDRSRVFQRVVEREVLLLQVAVVGEGVDLPIRRLIDVSPTMSPMKCMQRWGRVTRPTDVQPEVISCCHNFTRHSYLWHGVVPPSVIRENLKQWGKDFKFTRRDMARAIGLEGFGKFIVNHVPLSDGTTGSLYVLQTKDGMTRYAVVLTPNDPEPMYFVQEFAYTGETSTFTKNGHEIEYRVKTKPKWRQIAAMPELTECVSVKADNMTPAMANWWRTGGHRFGLDSKFTPNSREFQILPILANTRKVLA